MLLAFFGSANGKEKLLRNQGTFTAGENTERKNRENEKRLKAHKINWSVKHAHSSLFSVGFQLLMNNEHTKELCYYFNIISDTLFRSIQNDCATSLLPSSEPSLTSGHHGKILISSHGDVTTGRALLCIIRSRMCIHKKMRKYLLANYQSQYDSIVDSMFALWLN